MFWPRHLQAQTIEQRMTELSAILTQLEQSGIELQNLSAQQEQQLQAYKDQLTKLSNELKISKGYSTQLEQQITDLEQSVKTLQTQLDAAKTSLANFETVSSQTISQANKNKFIVGTIAGIVGFATGLIIGLLIK